MIKGHQSGKGKSAKAALVDLAHDESAGSWCTRLGLVLVAIAAAAVLGSKALTFVPGKVRSGEFRFAIGSPGNLVMIELASSTVTEIFTASGKLGVSAAAVLCCNHAGNGYFGSILLRNH